MQWDQKHLSIEAIWNSDPESRQGWQHMIHQICKNITGRSWKIIDGEKETVKKRLENWSVAFSVQFAMMVQKV